MKFNVGIIGLGMIGESMLAEFVKHPSFTVAAAWDLNPEINRHIANKFPQVQLATDATTIIENPDIQLIYIATPPVTHVDYGLQVAATKKALLCEKPLSIKLDRGQQLVDKVIAAGIPTAMNFVYGAGSIVDTIAAQIDSNSLGTVTSIEIRYQFPSWPLPNQLSAAAWITKRHEGGMMREMHSHFVYLMQRLFGPMKTHSATIQYPQDSSLTEQFVVASMQTGDIPVWLMGGIGSSSAPRESEMTIHGTAASLRLSSLTKITRSENGVWQDLPLETTEISDAQARLDELALRLAGQDTQLPGLQEGLEVQKVIEALLANATHITSG